MARAPYHQLKWPDRIRIETLVKRRASKKDIANELGIHISTVYRELRRGQCLQRDTLLKDEYRYVCDVAQRDADWKQSGKGCPLKIGRDHHLAARIEETILEKKYSPEAALADLKRSGETFDTDISVRTLYRYIDSDVFLNISNKDLPVKGKKKRKLSRPKTQKRARAGTGIEKRPAAAASRAETGHWEMDTVHGKKGNTSCLLVLTERKTRQEIIRKLHDQKAISVIRELDKLEKEMGADFRRLFQTITLDNGQEFSDCAGLEKSVLCPGEKRVALYYCHPYSSFERGSNENNNRLLRRRIPKGTDLDSMTDQEIQEVEDWLNNYPRRMFHFQSSAEMYAAEMASLAAS